MKKIFNLLICLLFGIFAFTNKVFAVSGEASEFCSDTSPIWRFAGYILYMIKIIVPLIIIVLGIIDLFKAVTSNDEKAISKAAFAVGKRIIMGVAIFFVPTIVSFVFSLVAADKSNYKTCVDCLLHPRDNSCRNAVCDVNPKANNCK